MSYAALMVYVDMREDAPARIKLASNLAEVFDATLIGIAGSLPELPSVDPYGMGAMVGELMTLEHDRAQAAVQEAADRFKDLVTGRSIKTEWRGALSYPGSLLVKEARAADLIILGREAGATYPYNEPNVGDVLLSAGRPLLIVPQGVEKAPAGSAAIVAWKETKEARRAVHDALPLLRHIPDVTVVELSEKDDFEEAQGHTEDVVAFLSRHRIKATALAEVLGKKSAPERLLEIAKEKKADLIVMGGYGHARLREWTFGGVTRDLLQTSPLSILLSH
ncbi:universal stress protein [Beijerinckia indica]|uniref:UspA domain protein n=1 Tax=Beijerinckia indica subsp. indica (strain ATCC 9039 / DSM 1715 / NCIMB 8712) TaxID=395963 RepID=B2IGS7_BEII9|nr:universal stress protein [Beijerinckia indica]ACB95838.1 UspA domain protein [Beijerinckia indica subsp. indica ATCC 9039]